MTLIIAEKPSVAREISNVVGANKSEKGYKLGNGYIVSWCVGHLIELAQPGAYDAAYKVWDLNTLPIIPEVYKTEISAQTRTQYNILKDLINREDVTQLICATDAGREGELIFRLVYHKTKCTKPFMRLWISSMEEKSIRDGLANMKDGREYDNLYKAALCRQRADWLFGINLTRLYSKMYNKTLPAGRVQTPTVNLIVQRQHEIEIFTPTMYYRVMADLGSFKAYARIDEKAAADDVVSHGIGKNAVVKSATKEEKKELPPALYDLTTLQRDANRLLGYSAKQTLNALQSLYDAKLATYPRTDSKYITADMASSTSSLIDWLLKNGFFSDIIKEYNTNNTDLKRVINDSKVTDHHAILPTQSVTIDKYTNLPTTEKNILSLIILRLLSATYAPYVFTSTNVILDIENVDFEATGKEILQLGYRMIENAQKTVLILPSDTKSDQKQTQENTILPALSEGDIFDIVDIKAEGKKTQPPKPYTEDTLLSAMENAGKDIEDSILKDAMKDRGLGTPATRAEIIENIIAKGYICRSGKNLMPTDQAKTFVRFIPDRIKHPDLTADWEYQLSEIQTGKYSDTAFMESINEFLRSITKETLLQYSPESSGNMFPKPVREPIGICPRCGKNIVEWDKSYSCESGKDGCKFVIWKTIAGRNITSAQAQKLLKKKKTDLIKGFTSKVGNKFNAYIVLKEDCTTAFEFER